MAHRRKPFQQTSPRIYSLPQRRRKPYRLQRSSRLQVPPRVLRIHARAQAGHGPNVPEGHREGVAAEPVEVEEAARETDVIFPNPTQATVRPWPPVTMTRSSSARRRQEKSADNQSVMMKEDAPPKDRNRRHVLSPRFQRIPAHAQSQTRIALRLPHRSSVGISPGAPGTTLELCRLKPWMTRKQRKGKASLRAQAHSCSRVA